MTGYCECGCGQRTTVADKTNRQRGYAKGEPRRFVLNHHRRRASQEFIEVGQMDCWVWQLSRSANGYGQVRREGKARKAHRLYYEELVGPIPDGLQLDHLCRNRACVNPGHLEPVTNAENARRGNQTKLTATDVAAIRASAERNVDLAERYGISSGHISQIRTGQVWP